MAINWNKAGKSYLLGGMPFAAGSVLDDQWFGGKVGDAFASLDPNDYEGRRKAQENADRLAALAGAAYDGINVPTKDDYQDYSWLGDLAYGGDVDFVGYDPVLADLALQGDSAFNNIELDPRFQQVQMEGLNSLGEIIDGGGFSKADEANLSRIQGDVAAADKGRRDAIQQNMQRRGMSGSGMNLLAQMQSNEAATDRASQSGLDIAAMGQERSRQAILDRAGLGRAMANDDYSRQADLARATDAINRFNTSNTNNNSQFNASTSNDAARYNSGVENDQTRYNTDRRDDVSRYNHSGRQNTADRNTSNRNNITNSIFDNSMSLATGKSNAALGHASHYGNKADRIQDNINSTNQGIINLVGTGTQAYLNSDEDCKHDIEPIKPEAIEEFLEAIKPKKFRYKNKKHGEGERIGIVIQDIEPTEIGASLTTITDEGTKAIDKDNLLGVIMDSLSHLHDKKKDK